MNKLKAKAEKNRKINVMNSQIKKDRLDNFTMNIDFDFDFKEDIFSQKLLGKLHRVNKEDVWLVFKQHNLSRSINTKATHYDTR